MSELLVKRKIPQPETHVLVAWIFLIDVNMIREKEQDLYRVDLNITSKCLKIYVSWVFHARVYFKFNLHVINSR